jgi:hypothetical protein
MGQAAASTASLGDGRFVVAWTSYGQTAPLSAEDVYGVVLNFPTYTTPPSVTLTQPNGGETLSTTAAYSIEWSASDDVAVTSIDVEFSTNGGGAWSPIAACTDLAGDATSCSWTPPSATSQGRVRVTAHDAAGQSASDASEANFSVVAGAFVTVTAPSATGISWQAGAQKQIRFNHNLGKNKAVTIELSRDDGGNWTTIDAAHLTTGAKASTFQWTVTAPITTAARIRVTLNTNPAVSDVGNAPFTITSRVKVTQPNAALVWKAGSSKKIKWSHNFGASMQFTIALDDPDPDPDCNNGTLATNVTASSASAGVYNWTVAGSGAGYRVCVTAQSADPANDTDVSDTAFSITP